MMTCKPLVLIVEGPDRCGKGTFIEEFCSITTTSNIIRLHSGKPPNITGIALGDYNICHKEQKKWAQKYNQRLLHNVNILSKTNDIIILDRSYIGEYVYGNMYRKADYSNRDFNDFELDNLKLNDINCVLINFSDSAENLIKRDDGNSHSTDIERKNEELNRFVELHKISIIEEKYMINWSNTEFSKQNLREYSHSILKTWGRKYYGS